jgi:hypothetical protein
MATPPVFTTGAVLTAAQMNGVGLWLVKTQTVGTGVSSVTVTNAFSADYDNYKIVVTGGVGSTSLALNVRLGASATGYYGMLNYATYSAASISAAGIVNGTSWVYGGVASTNMIAMNMDLSGPFLAKTTTMSAIYSEASTTGAAGSFNGFHNSAVSYTDLTIICGAGTITGGTIRVYGYRN